VNFLRRSLVGAAAVLLLAATARAERLRSHFDSDALNRPPGFFDFAVLGAPGQARWIVVNDDTAPSLPQAAAQVIDSRPDGSIAAALRRNSAGRDGTWSVMIKRGAGRAGLVLRMADERNFVVLLVDCGSGDARLTSYRGGKPYEIASGRGAFNTGWVRLTVSGQGPALSATFDDKPLLQATDPNPASGRAGMATTGPGAASFDEFVMDAADSAVKP
jgi:hypothetical protein